MGKESHNSQITKEGSESIFLVATYCLEPVGTTDLALKYCYQPKIEKCDRR